MMPLPVDRPTRRLAYGALLLALALLLSYIEHLVPLSFVLPGMKVGLPNVAVMYAFFHLDKRSAAVISFLRVLLGSLLFGSAASLFFSLLGAAFSYAVLLLLSCAPLGRVGISVGCAAAHGTGQILAATVLYGTSVISYLPYMLLAALPFGALCGLLLYMCERLLPW